MFTGNLILAFQNNKNFVKFVWWVIALFMDALLKNERLK